MSAINSIPVKNTNYKGKPSWYLIKPSWYLIKQYINQFKPGDIISRQDMKNFGIPLSSVDIYRIQLCSAGILCKHTRGKYKILYNIPEQMTTTLLFEISCYYNVNSWKGWFMTLEDKIIARRSNFFNE